MATRTKPAPTLADLEAEAVETRDQFMKELDMAREVRTKLEEHVDKVILKLLGFDNHWSRDWEIDHCNGRSGNSFIGDQIAEKASAACVDFVNDAIGRGIELTAQQKQAVIKEYREQLFRRVMNRAEVRASREADSIVESVLMWTPDEAKAQVEGIVREAKRAGLSREDLIALLAQDQDTV